LFTNPNETAPVRPGEEVNAESLEEYLRARIPTPFDRLEIEQFPAGSSNLTYLIKLGGTSLVLRRPPYGNTVRTAHDMKREFQVLSKLANIYPPAPEPVLFCDDVSVIGTEFYLMERRSGLVLRGDVPDSIRSSREMQLATCRTFMRNLASLHEIDLEDSGLSALGNPVGYCRRQVDGWSKRYEAAKTHDHAELQVVITWLNERVPPESAHTLVHNDYKFDNIVLDPSDPTRIVAVLDWEMVTVGDPLMDLGTTLGYWMSSDAGDEMLRMPFNPRVLMENVTRRQLADMYSEFSGRDTTDLLFYYVFGTFKIAVIAQQIYARWAKGSTRDERFASFDKFVAALGWIANTAIHRGTI
jgi:aminoglycoside phosphotransferase (APT) family kinase protein